MLKPVFHCETTAFAPVLALYKKLFRKVLQSAFDEIDLPANKYVCNIVLTDDAALHELNRDFRHKDKPTNVLSFPQIEDFDGVKKSDMPVELGDVFLAFETIRNEAKTQGKPLENHVAHLMLHGLLHLLGFDHETKKQAAEMESFETEILAQHGIADPYV